MKYNTSKKYKCPYCNYVTSRDALVSHISNDHENEIPEESSAARVVFNHINKKDHGTCVVCKKDTKWNEESWKYNRICTNPKCKEKLSDVAHNNVLKIYGTSNLAERATHQKKMLKGRKISGTYKFSDGKLKGYTGKNEMKCLEFMDKVMNIPSIDIITPGPTLKYEFNGTEHFYITDIYYVPANLIIECKDGGDNPNTRPMVEYREKQVAKEEMITNVGKFNYIRLTNNNFAQLLEIFANIKYQMIDDSDDNRKTIIKINEEVGGLPPSWANDISCSIIQYGQNNTFVDNNDVEGYGLTTLGLDDNMIIRDENGKNKKVNIKDFLENRRFNIYKSSSPISIQFFNELCECSKAIPDWIDRDTRFTEVNIYKSNKTTDTILQEVQKYISKEGK